MGIYAGNNEAISTSAFWLGTIARNDFGFRLIQDHEIWRRYIGQ